MATTRESPAFSGEALHQLAARIRGPLIQPTDPVYDRVRAVYNGMIDKHPALIVQAADVADVVATVNFARENGLLLAIRGGGHNVAGSSANDDGIVIDLSRMREVQVDPERKRAIVAGGATWADVDTATHAHGLATPGGFVSTTGVGGLTLGGGLGHLTRKYGLTIDNLLAAEIVLADGTLVTANAESHPDLFWGLRGGGNFGVVTSFTFQLHPVRTVYGGALLYPVERAAELLRFYREFIGAAPDDVNTLFAFLVVPPDPHFPADLQGKTMCALVTCYTGPAETAEAAVRPMREVGPPALDMLGSLPFPVLQSMFDESAPFGLQQYWKADFVRALTDETIAIHSAFGPRIPNPFSIVHLYPVNGAVHRVAAGATAYAHRNAHFVHVIGAASPDPAEVPAYTQWVRDYWAALHPHAVGAYVNFMMDEGEDRIRGTYGANYERLQAVKARYDPANLFRVNQNIRPA